MDPFKEAVRLRNCGIGRSDNLSSWPCRTVNAQSTFVKPIYQVVLSNVEPHLWREGLQHQALILQAEQAYKLSDKNASPG